MGEIADMIIDGTICKSCGGLVDGSGPGYPRKCKDCGDPGWRNRAKKRRIQASAIEAFDDAKDLAGKHGLTLRHCSDVHYQLSDPAAGWLLNLYPTKHRIYPDKNRPRSPYLDLAGVSWSLLDVVRAAIAKAEGGAE